MCVTYLTIADMRRVELNSGNKTKIASLLMSKIEEGACTNDGKRFLVSISIIIINLVLI